MGKNKIGKNCKFMQWIFRKVAAVVLGIRNRIGMFHIKKKCIIRGLIVIFYTRKLTREIPFEIEIITD